MKILYDHQAFTMQRFGGVSKCFCEIIKCFKHSHVNYDISVKECCNEHLIASGIIPNLRESKKWDKNTFLDTFHCRGNLRFYNFLDRALAFPFIDTINRKYSIELLRRGDYDVFHPTFFDSYFLKYLHGKPFVLTVHDMMPELFPEYFGYNDPQIILKKQLVRHASAIIAVSQQTKNDLMRLLDVPDNLVKVVYHGAPPIEHIAPGNYIDAPFFLYVGTRWGYKNFRQLLFEFSRFLQRCNEDIKLLCTGSPFTIEEIQLISHLSLEKSVFHMKASDDLLKHLYASAIAFVFPSLYEGFGMPILEAFAYGCPVVLNNSSCFPEIAGNAAVYFDSSQNGFKLSDALLEVINMPHSDRLSLISKGYERLSLFSWKKSSCELQSLYKSLC